jgi:hypothetical protein
MEIRRNGRLEMCDGQNLSDDNGDGKRDAHD